jgi:hypothetical protein
MLRLRSSAHLMSTTGIYDVVPSFWSSCLWDLGVDQMANGVRLCCARCPRPAFEPQLRRCCALQFLLNKMPQGPSPAGLVYLELLFTA